MSKRGVEVIQYTGSMITYVDWDDPRWRKYEREPVVLLDQFGRKVSEDVNRGSSGPSARTT